MSTIGKVCAKCRIELRAKKNGVMVVEMAGFGPCAIHQADLWACPECGMEVVVGFGRKACAYHYEETFEAVMERLRRSDDPVIEFWATQSEKEGQGDAHAG